MDRAQAIKASRNGAIAAFICGSMTLAFFLLLRGTNVSGVLKLYSDPLNLWVVIVIFACGIGMLYKSRLAAIIVFVDFLISKVATWQHLTPFRFAIAATLLYFFGKAVQGTFTYHKIEKKNNPNYKPPSKWMYYVGITIGIIISGLMLLGTLLGDP